MSRKPSRLLLAAVSVCVAALPLTACASGQAQPDTQKSKAEKSESTKAESTEAERSESTEAKSPESENTSEDAPKAESTPQPLTWEGIDGTWCDANGECSTFLDGMTKFVFRGYPPIKVRQLEKQGDCFNALVYNEGGGGAGGYLACGVGVKPPADFGNFADGDLGRERLYPVPQNTVPEPMQPMYRQE